MGELIALVEPMARREPDSVSAAWHGAVRALSQQSVSVTRGVDLGSEGEMDDESATFGGDAELVVLTALYDFVGRAQVARFLRRRQDLILPLAAAYHELTRQGTVVGPVILEYVVDPEEGYDFLAVSASIAGSPPEILSALRELDKWWLTQPASVRNSIIVSLLPA
ncbi:MAG: hypothetical protein AB7Y46_12760 [Armatimonadota bacterium]